MSTEIKTILYATDMGEHMRPVFRFAVSLAEKYGAKISMLHVTEPLTPQVRWAIEAYMPDSNAQQVHHEGFKKIQDEMQVRLADFCKEEMGKSPEECDLVSNFSVVPGRPAETITEAAEKMDADLIVVGTHTDPSFGAYLLGSTARKVTQLSKKPVLVIPVCAH
ncbi:MAG: universal stress protein [Gammaproteobacteria bacterium]|nr:MAG: universal stress protein [Gammaproteobacteria bacterium]